MTGRDRGRVKMEWKCVGAQEWLFMEAFLKTAESTAAGASFGLPCHVLLLSISRQLFAPSPKLYNLTLGGLLGAKRAKTPQNSRCTTCFSPSKICLTRGIIQSDVKKTIHQRPQSPTTTTTHFAHTTLVLKRNCSEFYGASILFKVFWSLNSFAPVSTHPTPTHPNRSLPDARGGEADRWPVRHAVVSPVTPPCCPGLSSGHAEPPTCPSPNWIVVVDSVLYS